MQAARDFGTTFVGGAGLGECYLGPSSTACVAQLAEAYAGVLQPGDKIIVEEAGHETNIGPWTRLGDRCEGVETLVWEVEKNDAAESPIAKLEEMLVQGQGSVRLVAVAHVSNILGQILPLVEVTELCHKHGARVICDGVAYAAHRIIDVAESGVDFYFWSPYKVFAPHLGCMFGTTEAFKGLVGPNHFFMPQDSVPQMFEYGFQLHEASAGFVAFARHYLPFLNSLNPTASPPAAAAAGTVADRATVVGAYEVVHALELPLQVALVEYVRASPVLRLIGTPKTGVWDRVAQVSFLHTKLGASAVVAQLNAKGICCRNGHMFAYRLAEALPDVGTGAADGTIRMSLAHYNTPEEVARCIEAIDGLEF